jgi:ubiquinone/menaquinone biosynthesis C-methylase UbiE
MTTTSIRDLLAALQELAGIPDREWLGSLDERKRTELEFHDRDRDREAVAQLDAKTFEELHGNKKFYSVVDGSRTYVRDWIASHAPGRVVLDYACGNGVNAIHAARSGAALAVGLDISSVSVENAARDAAGVGVGENTFFVQGDCEDTRLPPDSVDTVICSGMLHHLDLSYAFPELRRIMKPGAVLLGVEALDVNPVIKLYRKLTPAMRTEWEKRHILSHRHLRFAQWFFDVRSVRYWHLFVIPAALVRRTPFFRPLTSVGNALDSVAMRVPLLNRLAWQFTFELHKR